MEQKTQKLISVVNQLIDVQFRLSKCDLAENDKKILQKKYTQLSTIINLNKKFFEIPSVSMCGKLQVYLKNVMGLDYKPVYIVKQNKNSGCKIILVNENPQPDSIMPDEIIIGKTNDPNFKINIFKGNQQYNEIGIYTNYLYDKNNIYLRCHPKLLCLLWSMVDYNIKKESSVENTLK